MDKKAAVRIHKALSDSGVLSRRKAEESIEQGRVTVNGRVAKIGQKIIPAVDIVTVDGVKVDFSAQENKRYIALYKPRGYVTTMSDELGRRNVTSLIAELPGRLYPVGRLDLNSEGLLLLTDDGEFANLIMHPRNHVSKTYRVTVRPDINDEQLVQLASGVALDDGDTTLPAQVRVINKEPGRVVMELVIREGKNRQVRRMCEAVGLEVARLRRTAVGPVRLGMLAPGEWRELEPRELNMLRNAAGKAAASSEDAPRTTKPSGAKPHNDVKRSTKLPKEKMHGSEKWGAKPSGARKPGQGAKLADTNMRGDRTRRVTKSSGVKGEYRKG